LHYQEKTQWLIATEVRPQGRSLETQHLLHHQEKHPWLFATEDRSQERSIARKSFVGARLKNKKEYPMAHSHKRRSQERSIFPSPNTLSPHHPCPRQIKAPSTAFSLSSVLSLYYLVKLYISLATIPICTFDTLFHVRSSRKHHIYTLSPR
jgi:hypothetical protein